MPSSSASSGRRSSKSHNGLLFNPLPSRADPEERSTRKSKEKESGAFDWTPGIAIALLGALTLLDVEKSINKKERREKEEEEHRERERERERRRRSSVSASSGGRSRYGSGSSSSSNRYHDRYDDRYDDGYDDRYDDRYYDNDYDSRYSYDRGYDQRDHGYSSRRGSW